ncbi:MAG: IS4 family transposase [Hyphomicrobiales bacterium]|nr:IS4 family transposase [Hyphomicrobiales bacterium]
MRHTNSVFHDLLKLVPWATFDKLVVEFGSDDAVRRFTTRHHFLALLFAQFGGASSLREVEAVMASHRARLYHVGANAPKRSTLADANRDRDPRVFAKLFAHMLAATPRGFRRTMGDAVRLIDSTSLRLAGAGAQWARFSSDVFGAKAHVIYDPDLGRPVYHAVTAANVNDITAAKAMPIEAGATYVFDLGYYDFSWWARLDAAGCRLVTRFKANTPLREATIMPLAEGSDVLSDRIGFLPARQAANRKNPMHDAVREIVVETETGKRLRILSNDLDAPAQEIADLYKRRWQIELFFRVMKQTLKITKFLGRSENAVRTQLAVALIAFLLLRALQEITKATHGFLELVRLVRANLTHRRDAARLRHNDPPRPLDHRQLELNWAMT